MRADLCRLAEGSNQVFGPRQGLPEEHWSLRTARSSPRALALCRGLCRICVSRYRMHDVQATVLPLRVEPHRHNLQQLVIRQ